ncbi:hypothetical protein [Weissella viridescens]|uniref:hypothetical protein n=1 Tax=Weissella viridescens TaxID=1629 RepID=UPI001C8A3A69|nr:hypothetical protein [Weissella viridescens]
MGVTSRKELVMEYLPAMMIAFGTMVSAILSALGKFLVSSAVAKSIKNKNANKK